MFADLPLPLQEKIKKLLLKDDFVSAKRIYDDYKRKNIVVSKKSSPNPNDPVAQESI